MANRYGYQFNMSLKPRMGNIDGFVSIGTGGLPNSVIGIASGGQLAHSGTYYGIQPGAATAGVPTGWQGTYSGTSGLYGAGVAGISRIATGLYSVQLSDDWVRLDSCQVQTLDGTLFAQGGATSPAAVTVGLIVNHSVGYGNTVTTGFAGVSGLVGANLKNQILIQFYTAGTIAELDKSAGFFMQLRLRDSLSGPQ